MIRYSGENFYMPAAYVSASACATLLNMTDDEKSGVKRRPVGFAPPMPTRPAGKPRIRPKAKR